MELNVIFIIHCTGAYQLFHFIMALAKKRCCVQNDKSKTKKHLWSKQSKTFASSYPLPKLKCWKNITVDTVKRTLSVLILGSTEYPKKGIKWLPRNSTWKRKYVTPIEKLDFLPSDLLFQHLWDYRIRAHGAEISFPIFFILQAEKIISVHHKTNHFCSSWSNRYPISVLVLVSPFRKKFVFLCWSAMPHLSSNEKQTFWWGG